MRIAREMGGPLVGTGDVHYLRREDYAHHAALLCVQTKSTLAEPKIRFETNEFYLKDSAGDGERLRGVAAGARHHARDRRALQRRDRARPPADPALPGRPTGATSATTCARVCEQGLRERYGDPPPAATLERMEIELEVIDRMGFNAYFLIVWDFVDFAKRNGIAVGPGRGSAAGSIVAYSLRDHRRRPARLRPPVRALPQPRARVDAGHRHRLLGARPRARAALRDREVRARVGRADRHLRQDGPARGDARRGARARARLRRRRPPREADPRPAAGPRAVVRGVPGAGEPLREAYDEDPTARRSSTSRGGSRGSCATPRSTPRRS